MTARKPLLILPTERDGVTLQQLRAGDAEAYFAALQASRPELEEFSPETLESYPDVPTVIDSIISPKPENVSKLRFGIWEQGNFAGSINVKPVPAGAEIGYWLDTRYYGRGLATIALRAVTDYAVENIGRPYAWTLYKNVKSMGVLQRSNYVHIGNWAGRSIFDFPRADL